MECGAWNRLEEVAVSDLPRHTHSDFKTAPSRVQSMHEVNAIEETRSSTRQPEFDRVLGGGLVQGSVVLLGGDPGIGKSTLLLQTLSTMDQCTSLYVSGEESPQQIALTARRLKLDRTDLRLLCETSVEKIISAVQHEKPQVMVLDSIQTLFTGALQSAPGSVAQVRESAAQLVKFAKQTNTAIFLVGHVTKEGALAGPRVLEHMVDCVLYFEGDPGNRYRVLRAVKNRFGAVNELGVFAMTETGLKGVSNPSAIFLSRHERPISGSTILVTREGTRPLLVEVQALVDETPLGNPRRITVGLEQNRLSMLLAVLHRHGNIPMYNQDVFVNIVGGVKITETAADLAVLLAVVSSFRDHPLSTDTVVFGEIGLGGEIRPVPNGEDRLKEAAKLGFKRAIIPAANSPHTRSVEIEIAAIHRLSDAILEL